MSTLTNLSYTPEEGRYGHMLCVTRDMYRSWKHSTANGEGKGGEGRVLHTGPPKGWERPRANTKRQII